MNSFTRGIRNAFRNGIRTAGIVIILSLSVGLALAMVIARQAVQQKITSVQSSTGNTITLSPAGVRGFEGGGNPLTEAQADQVKSLAHVVSLTESLNDRLTSTNTNLQSSITPGALGQRFAGNGGNFGGGGGGGGGFGGGGNGAAGGTFTLPVTVIGTTDPTNLAATQGGGTFSLKSGQVFATSSTDNVALVGSSLATKNNLSVGSTFTAYGSTVKVVGIFDAGNSFSNDLLVMPLSTVQTLSGQAGDLTTAIATVDSIGNVNSVTSAIQSKLGSAVDVTNAAQQASMILAPLQNIKSISLYSLIGAIVAGAVIILLTMVMIVRERRREIGVYKAIGASNLKVMFQFMVEAVTFTLLGAIIGTGLGVIGGSPITKILVNNSTTSATTTGGGAAAGAAGGFGGARTGGGGGFGGRAFRAVGLSNNNLKNIHAAVSWSILLYGLLAAVVIAIVGSAVSSLLIAKVRPAEVMRTE